MKSSKNKYIIAVIAVLSSFLAIGYVSCNKDKDKVYCRNVVCENRGVCRLDKCVCPTGYEGDNCSVPQVSKYLGKWTLKQTLIGSDSAMYIGDTAMYDVILAQSGTPTTFFIDNFAASKYYNRIVCTMDSLNSYNFRVDTFSAFHMVYDNYKILWGYGTIYKDTAITARVCIRYKNATTNWEIDTFDYKMNYHMYNY
jgi:hypothetical protein